MSALPRAPRGQRCGFLLDVALLFLPQLLAWMAFADLGGYPSNDDPFYARPVKTLAEEGRFEIVRQHGELTASSILHILIGGAVCSLTGFSYRTLFLIEIVHIGATAALIYGAARLLDVRRFVALGFGLSYVCVPQFFGRGFRFMTDPTATAWAAGALVCYLVAFRTERLRWLLAGSILAGAAFWIRQTHAAMVVFPIVGGALLMIRGWRLFSPIPALVAVAAPIVVSVALFESGLITHGNARRIDDAPPDAIGLTRLKEIVIAIDGLALNVGLMTLPLAPLLFAAALRKSRDLPAPRRRFVKIGTIVFLLGLSAPFVATSGRACLTNATGPFVQNAHYGPVFLSDSYERQIFDDMNGVTWPLAVWQVLTIAAIFSSTTLAWWGLFNVASWWADVRNDGWPLRFDLGIALLCVVPVVAAALFAVLDGILGRYWMVIYPLLFIWIAQIAGPAVEFRPRSAVVAAVVFWLALTTISVVFTRDMLAWNQARWRQVEAWLAEGRQPLEFDGGRDVNAWFRSAEDPDTSFRDGDASEWWSGHATLALSAKPRDGWQITDRLTWFAWATGRTHEILVLKKTAP